MNVKEFIGILNSRLPSPEAYFLYFEKYSPYKEKFSLNDLTQIVNNSRIIYSRQSKQDIFLNDLIYNTNIWEVGCAGLNFFSKTKKVNNLFEFGSLNEDTLLFDDSNAIYFNCYDDIQDVVLAAMNIENFLNSILYLNELLFNKMIHRIEIENSYFGKLFEINGNSEDCRYFLEIWFNKISSSGF